MRIKYLQLQESWSSVSIQNKSKLDSFVNLGHANTNRASISTVLMIYINFNLLQWPALKVSYS